MGNKLYQDVATLFVSPLCGGRGLLLTCNRHAGSQTLSLLRYVFLSGFFLMSRYVAKVSFYGALITTNFQNENLWNANKSYSVGGEHRLPYPSFSPIVTVTSTFFFFIDSPELGPGTVLGPSKSPTPSPSVNSTSNTGAIVGGVIGGVAAIFIAVAVIFFYLRRRQRRRRSRAPSVATPGVGASQPPMDEIKQPLTEGETNTGSSLPGTSSMPGTPGAPMKLYVRSHTSTALLCVLITCTFFYMRRTRMIQLRSLGTKGLCSHRPVKNL